MSLGMFVNAGVLRQVRRIKVVATPISPSLPSQTSAWAMAWVHMVVWNSWKSAYFYASRIPSGDFESYREYTLLAFAFLDKHHEVEERELFPVIEKKMPGTMKTNEEQHHNFLGGLRDMVGYMESTSVTKFEASTFRAKMDNIILDVVTHLADELDTLDSNKLLQFFTEDEIKDINESFGKVSQQHTMSALGRTRPLPFFFQSQPSPGSFPPVPGFVKSIIAPWVVYWPGRNLWKYTAFPYTATLEAVPADPE
ncbi:hypothetical protein DL96DRAFT_700566 [Flagelloscypha sp. PMI_526]|nr:hypothetical protein DL96DRAFT_700566 [Flagelloscypha sp. PMI_526]